MDKTQWPEGDPVAWEGWGILKRNIAGQLLIESDAVLQSICDAIPKDGTLIELGTWCSGTAAAVADARPDAYVIAVDDFGDCHARGIAYQRAILSLVNCLCRPNLSLLIGHTQTIGRRLASGCCDVCIVDADHTTEGCLADLRLAARLVGERGTILAHDYQPAWPDVAAAVDRFLADTPTWRIVSQVESLVCLSLPRSP
jgi:hypothetical protein